MERKSNDNFADINGVKLHFTDTGNPDGRPVVVMHGWGCDTSTVASIENAVADSRRVVNIDLPGHGKSSEPPLLSDGKPWGVYEFADAVEKLITDLGLENFTLVGHSYGGRLAIILGSRMRPEKIVLVDAAGIKPRRSLKYYLKVYSFKTYKKMARLLFGKKKGEAMIEKKRAKAGSADYRNASPMMKMVMSRSVNQDLRHHLPEIQAPTLLIWGELDTATPLRDAKLMEKLIPDAGLVEFKGCGHYSFLENPGQFRAVIRSFLKIQ